MRTKGKTKEGSTKDGPSDVEGEMGLSLLKLRRRWTPATPSPIKLWTSPSMGREDLIASILRHKKDIL